MSAAAVAASGLLLSACGSTVNVGTTGSGVSVSSADGTGLDGLGQPARDAAATTALPGATPSTGNGSGSAADASSLRPGSETGTLGPGSGSGSGSGSTNSSSATATTKPLTIGFLTTDTSNASSIGASYGNTLGESKVTQALVKALNDTGGIAGRKINAIYSKTDTGSTNWATDFNAACAKFTQDNHVDAVLGYSFQTAEGFEKCLTDKRVPHLSTTQDGPDSVFFQQNPYFFSLMTPSIERRSQLKIDGGLASGVITTKSKFGIVTDSCTYTSRSYAKTIKPYVLSKGISVLADQDVGCPQGASDAGAAVTALQNAMLRFRSAGVDTLLIDANSESGAVLLGSLFAEQQGWHPQWLLSSIASTAILQDNSTPPAQMRNMHVIGWEPLLDVAPNRYPAYSSSAKRCLALMKTQGITPTAAADFMYVMNVCDAVFTYESALTVTGGNSDPVAITRAIEATNTAHVSATTVGGLSVLTRSRHDAPAGYRVAGFQSACACFVYTSRPVNRF